MDNGLKNKTEKNENNKLINLIRVLLIMPFYIIAIVIFNFLNLYIDENSIIILVLIYLPPIIGLILAAKTYKINKKQYIKMIVLIIIANFLYLDGYIYEHDGFLEGLLSAYLFYPTILIFRRCLFKFLGNFTEKKKISIYFCIYLLFVVSACSLSFFIR